MYLFTPFEQLFVFAYVYINFIFIYTYMKDLAVKDKLSCLKNLIMFDSSLLGDVVGITRQRRLCVVVYERQSDEQKYIIDAWSLVISKLMSSR